MPKFQWRNQENFPYRLFIAAALLDLILLLAGFLVYLSAVYSSEYVEKESAESGWSGRSEEGDPLLTKGPGHTDLLAGPLLADEDPLLGQPEATVVIYQFADFECRSCAANLKVIKNAVNPFSGRVKFQWKDFPPSEVKSPAWQAALAARCSGDQGKFFEYSDLLFGADRLSDKLLTDSAKKLNLDLDRFKECLYGYKKNRNLLDNLTEAEALGISGVPTLYVNGKKFSGDIKGEEITKAIEKELNK